MKNLLKFLSLILIVLSVASCTKKKDWTCTCVEPILATEISTYVITDASEEEARKECNDNDVTLIGLMVDCELVE